MVLVIKTVEEFEKEVVNSDIPVIVDFYADWCGPCKMLAPIFTELSEEYTGEVKFVKINVEEVQEVAMRLDVMSIPTILFFKGGDVVGQQMGALPKPMLKGWIDSLK